MKLEDCLTRYFDTKKDAINFACDEARYTESYMVGWSDEAQKWMAVIFGRRERR